MLQHPEFFLYNKLTQKATKHSPHSPEHDPHYGTLTGTALLVKEGYEQRKKNKKDKK